MTPQFVLAFFSIVGSSLLLLVTLVTLATKQYIEKPYSKVKVVNSKSLVQTLDKETMSVIEKLKEFKTSVDALNNKRDELEREIVEKPIKFYYNDKAELQQYTEVPSIGVYQRASKGLRQLQGMRIEHLTLLREIGITSDYELSMQNPEVLLRKILERVRPHENIDWIPTKGMLLHWVRIANQK